MNKRGLTLESGLLISILVVGLVIVAVIAVSLATFYFSEEEIGASGGGLTLPSESSTGSSDANTGTASGSLTGSSGGSSTGTSNSGNTGNTNSQTSSSSEIFDVDIIIPDDGEIFDFNESIPLEFDITDTAGNLDSCWYNIDKGENYSINDCENTSFDSQEGSHRVYIFINGTEGETDSDNHDYEVVFQELSVSLITPENGSYLGSSNVEFTYTVSGHNLDSCSLLGNFNTTYLVNQTDSSVEQEENSFSLKLTENSFDWAISCNNTLGEEDMSGNWTFTVDLTNPNLTMIEPSQSTYFVSEIPVEFEYFDANPASCLVLYEGPLNGSIEQTECSGNENLNLSLTEEGNYSLGILARDLADNINFTNASFFVDLPDEPSCQFTSAEWNTTSVTAGEIVEMIVNGTNCDGSEVDFNVYQVNISGGEDLLVNQVPDSIFSGESHVALWPSFLSDPPTGNGSGAGSLGSGRFILIFFESFVVLFAFALSLRRIGSINPWYLLMIALIFLVIIAIIIVLATTSVVELSPPADYYFEVVLASDESVNISSNILTVS